MTILITGATGLVGSKIVALCLANNYTVHYLTTQKSKLKNEPNYKGFFWNPEHNEIDLDCFNKVDAIINLAGATIAKRWTKSYKQKIINSRIQSLKTLHKAIQSLPEHNIKTLVSASAIGVYPSSLTEFYSENDEADNSFLAQVVQQWEKAAYSFKQFSMSVCMLRIGLVLDKNQGGLPALVKPVKYYVGAPLGSGKQWQSWIHINDIARLFLFAVTNNLNGVYNAVAANPVTQKQLVKTVAKQLKKPLWLPNIPSVFLRLLLGEMAYVILASHKVSNKKIIEAGFNFNYNTVDKALADILA